MVISSIERQKRRSNRVSVFLDEEFWVGMSERLFEELALQKGQTINEETKKAIEGAVVEDGALEYALARLADRAYTEQQIKDKLLGKGYGEEIAEMVIDRCRELYLLDDRSLAEMLIEERQGRGYGKRWIQNKLNQMGVNKQTSKDLLEEMIDEDEEAAAIAALQKKYGTDPLMPDKERRAMEFLMRRGFSPAAARGAASKQRASDDLREKEYGAKQASEALQKRYGTRKPEKDKARAFLARKGFSLEAIQQALREWE